MQATQRVQVLPFTVDDKIETVNYRRANWRYDPKGNASAPDFKVNARHSRGCEPFYSVDFEVYVGGRQSNEHFTMTRQDCEAMAKMFSDVASKMEQYEEGK